MPPLVWLAIALALWLALVSAHARERRRQAMEAVEAWYEEAQCGDTIALEALGAAIEALKYHL